MSQSLVDQITLDCLLNKETMGNVSKARCNSGLAGIFYLIISGVYRQQCFQNVALYIAGFLGKL